MRTNISLEEAVEVMKQLTHPLEECETLPLKDATNRILAHDVLAPLSQPIFSRSAVDGYALRHQDSVGADETPIHLQVIDTVYAGGYCDKMVGHKEAVHIMTGAPIPQGVDAVIRLEDTNDHPDHLLIQKELRPLENICLKGEDFKEGTRLLKKGDRLDYVRLALASSVGINCLEVVRKPRIGLCISGDEVTPPGEPLTPGKIYDSNFTLLYQRLKQVGYEPVKTAYVQDDASYCAKTLSDMAKDCDLIITTGGVSVGDKDILHEALDYAGAEKIFWRVLMKPGTPALFSLLQDTPVLSLSGNPFAASATFELLAMPLLGYLAKDRHVVPIPVTGILETSFPKVSDKRRMVRANYHQGRVSIPNGMHSSGAISTLMDCNCLLDIPAHSPACQCQDQVTVWLLGGYTYE